MTESSSSEPTPEPRRKPPEDETTERIGARPPLHVLDQILSVLLEAVEECDGDMDAVDIEAVADRFPHHRSVVFDEWEAQRIRSRRAQSGMIGPYRRMRQIGKGGMGVVWEAFDPRVKRSVAIKQLKTEPVLTGTSFANGPSRLDREAEVLAALDHPNVVRVYEFEVLDGTSCLVMELVRGASLNKLIGACRGGRVRLSRPSEGYLLRDVIQAGMAESPAAESPTAPAGAGGFAPQPEWSDCLRGKYLGDICRSLAGAARGLAYAHGRGLVHRDIKPGNLIIARDGTIKIADFGLAKGGGLARLSVTGEFIGTYQYASPEQVSMRHAVEAPSDVWSLGVTLYELVTLKLPFPQDACEDLFREIRTGKPPHPRLLNSRIPAPLEGVILRCLEKDPALRPTAEQLATSLQQFADGEYVAMGPVPIHRRFGSWLRRPTRWSTAVMVAAAAILLVWATSLWASHREQMARVEEAVAEAQEHLEAVETRRDPGEVAATLKSVRRLRALSSAPRIEGEALRILGRLAARQADHEDAVRSLTAASAVFPLGPDDALLLARSTFASGDLDGARRRYGALNPDARKLVAPGEESLVRAFGDGVPVEGLGPYMLHAALPAQGVGGLPAGSFIPCVDHRPLPWSLVAVVPEGDRARVVPIAPPRSRRNDRNSVDNLAVAPATAEVSARLVVAVKEGFWVTAGPLTEGDHPVWTKIHDPEPSWNVAVDDSKYTTMLPAALDSDVFLAGWYRSGSVLPLKGSGPGVRWPAPLQGSDIQFAKTVAWKGEPVVILGLGPWSHFSLHLLTPGRGGRLVPRSRVRMGTPDDAVVLHRPDGTDLLLVSCMAQESYMSDLLLGRANPYGWEFGLYALDEEVETGSLVPRALALHPRPWTGRARLHVADVLGDDGDEILFSEQVMGVDGVRTLCRTRVLRITGGVARPRFEHVLWLPGIVRGVARDATGARLLFIEDCDEAGVPTRRLVRLAP